MVLVGRPSLKRTCVTENSCWLCDTREHLALVSRKGKKGVIEGGCVDDREAPEREAVSSGFIPAYCAHVSSKRRWLSSTAHLFVALFCGFRGAELCMKNERKEEHASKSTPRTNWCKYCATIGVAGFSALWEILWNLSVNRLRRCRVRTGEIVHECWQLTHITSLNDALSEVDPPNVTSSISMSSPRCRVHSLDNMLCSVVEVRQES